ncbi:threonylcarbamoyl-AMP synthase [candidate division KSB1 bacterium]|nr:threonylcarbamoyl-AMP synthase [candidate division KSB1 bacterium]
MRTLKVDSNAPAAAAVASAVEALRHGEVLAYLTDTMYGLGVDARQETAIARLYALKQRAQQKAMPLIVGSKELLSGWIKDFPPPAEKLAQHFWPGPLTLIFHASATVSPRLTAGTDKIAMRVPNSMLARELSLQLGAPITSTSANLSGDTAVLTVAEIIAQLGKVIDLILDAGTILHSVPSTIVDVTTMPPRIVRQGVVEQHALEKIIGAMLS